VPEDDVNDPEEAEMATDAGFITVVVCEVAQPGAVS
jgi:hypothetical protein